MGSLGPWEGGAAARKKNLDSLSASLHRLCGGRPGDSALVVTITFIDESDGQEFSIGSYLESDPKANVKDDRDEKRGIRDSMELEEKDQLKSSNNVKLEGGKDEVFKDAGCFTLMERVEVHYDKLAEKSQWFSEHLSSGHDLPVYIKASEENAFIEVMEFIYGSPLSEPESSDQLLNILKIAAKYSVASCIEKCCSLLVPSITSPESAVLYFELASQITLVDAVLPLTDAALKVLVTNYKDDLGYQEAFLKLSLPGVKAVLCRDDLRVPSEDSVYDLVLMWARNHYLDEDKRREALSLDLGELIRFPHLSLQKLNEAIRCSDFDHAFMLNSALEAWNFKSLGPYHRMVTSEEGPSEPSDRAPQKHDNSGMQCVQRDYSEVPVKVVVLGPPHECSVVYFGLTWKEFTSLSPSETEYTCYKQAKLLAWDEEDAIPALSFPTVHTQPFHFAGRSLIVAARCLMHPTYPTRFDMRQFCLDLWIPESSAAPFALRFDIAMRSRRYFGSFDTVHRDFVVVQGGKYVRIFNKVYGYFQRNGLYCYDDVMYMRLNLSVSKQGA